MTYILRPVIFYGSLAAVFIYGNSFDPKTLDDLRGYFLLACVPIFVLSWYFAPARIIWLLRSMRDKSDAERLIKRNQVIGWFSVWGIISLTLFVVSQVQNGFWRQFLRH